MMRNGLNSLAGNAGGVKEWRTVVFLEEEAYPVHANIKHLFDNFISLRSR
jgi:hypothetical protein